MKIKFIKEYRAAFGDTINDELVTNGIYPMGAVRDATEKSAQWLIDNGFAEEVKSGWWKPKSNESYYFLGTIGEAGAIPWYNDKLDKYRYSVGNCFKTKDAAERYRDYLKAIATVRQDEGVLTPEQAAEDDIYYIRINEASQLVVHGFNADYVSVNTIPFDTREHAEASCKKHQDEWKIIANYDWSRE